MRSGNIDLVRGILDWGTQRGYTWPITSGGPCGVTPLHLAALLEDDGVMALTLLDACEGPDAFSICSTDDGVTPFHMAFQQGHYSLDRVLRGLHLLPNITRVSEEKPLTGWDLLRAADAAEDGEEEGAGKQAVAAAAAAGREWRMTHQLDACLNCQSMVPPLLISIMAQCVGCGQRQPCVADNQKLQQEQQAVAAAATAAAAAALGRKGRNSSRGRLVAGGDGAGEKKGPVKRARNSSYSAAAVAAAAAAVCGDERCSAQGECVCKEGGDRSCAHEKGRVLCVKAMCQTCHANRVLEVA